MASFGIEALVLGSSCPTVSKYAIFPFLTTIATAPGKLFASICRASAGAMRPRRSFDSPTSSGLAVGSALATSGNSTSRRAVRTAVNPRMDDLRL